GGTADRNRSHWSTSKTPSYTKSVSWQHHQKSLLDKVDAPSTCATRNLYSSDTITPDYFPSPEYE
ncbi:hypothetical protein SNC30_11155, partial [Escherichia coli]|nr:hypothetical protein [Escherichia coli]